MVRDVEGARRPVRLRNERPQGDSPLDTALLSNSPVAGPSFPSPSLPRLPLARGLSPSSAEWQSLNPMDVPELRLGLGGGWSPWVGTGQG